MNAPHTALVIGIYRQSETLVRDLPDGTHVPAHSIDVYHYQDSTIQRLDTWTAYQKYKDPDGLIDAIPITTRRYSSLIRLPRDSFNESLHCCQKRYAGPARFRHQPEPDLSRLLTPYRPQIQQSGECAGGPEQGDKTTQQRLDLRPSTPHYDYSPHPKNLDIEA